MDRMQTNIDTAFISMDDTLGNAINLLLTTPTEYLFVQDSSGKQTGTLHRNFILKAYAGNLSITSRIRDVLACIPDAGKHDEAQGIDRIRELNDIIQNSSDSIYVTDGDGVTIMVNRAFEKMSGIAREEVLGKTVFELEQKKLFTPSVTSIVLKEKRQITIIQVLKNNEKVIATGVPIFSNEGEIYRVVCNSKNLDELQILREFIVHREKAEKDALKTEMDIRGKGFVFESEKMKKIVELIKRIAQVDTTILLTGESGVGKSVLARYIHRMSPRAEGRFVEVNCGAIPEGLLESELFGYEGGAFTDAKKSGKQGIFESAHGGTLFLDEISELSPALQVKLLNAIQNRQIVRVGGIDPVSVDVRIISAANRNLEKRVRDGAFRLDLYYRLNVVPVTLPPLRERKEDIIPLARYFLKRHGDRYDRSISFSSSALDFLACYGWPGNIRELENIIERAVVTLKNDYIDIESLRHLLVFPGESGTAMVTINQIVNLKTARAELERQLVSAAYAEFRNSYRVAEILGISQSTAHRKIREYCL